MSLFQIFFRLHNPALYTYTYKYMRVCLYYRAAAKMYYNTGILIDTN